mgnify:CR=1 FL=1
MTLHDSDFTRPGSDREGADRTSSADTATAGTLEGVRRTETIADRVDFDSVRSELPDDWEVKPDLVQFGSEALAETVTFERTAVDPKLILKPTDASDPGGEIEFYERSDARATRRPTRTVDSLPEALRVAVNRVHQFNS